MFDTIVSWMGLVKDEPVCTVLILYIRIKFSFRQGFAQTCWCNESDMDNTIIYSLQMFQASWHMK